MAFKIIKNNEHLAVLKVVAGTSNTITLADFAYLGVTPTGAIIRSVFYSSDPSNAIEIIRNTAAVTPDAILDLWGSGYIDFKEKFGTPIASSSDQDIGVNPKNASNVHYTIILEVIKQV